MSKDRNEREFGLYHGPDTLPYVDARPAPIRPRPKMTQATLNRVSFWVVAIAITVGGLVMVLQW